MAVSSNVLRQSFQAVKADILAIKDSLQGWVLYLYRRTNIIDERLARLEARLAKIESDLLIR
ncbi:hypothetical protein HYU19_05670 [Candidatus Woesearchaeota archaeon]|nr:hypothetical protein [Candidatus Woesearchaeota archaeon]